MRKAKAKAVNPDDDKHAHLDVKRGTKFLRQLDDSVIEFFEFPRVDNAVICSGQKAPLREHIEECFLQNQLFRELFHDNRDSLKQAWHATEQTQGVCISR